MDEALAKSASFPWACPACFKKGIAAVQRAALKPTGQRVAGAKKRKRRNSSSCRESRWRLSSCRECGWPEVKQDMRAAWLSLGRCNCAI